MLISEIFIKHIELLDSDITVNGWIVTSRSQKDVTFIKLNDGSHPEGIQVITNSTDKFYVGMSLIIDGKLVKSPAEGQLFEIQATNIKILGQCDPTEYPLSKTKMSLDYLRNYNHLRFRTSSFGSIFRIKSAISHATHIFFEENNYLHLDPNILTVNECEGGAGVFQVTEKDISLPKKLALETVEILNPLTNKKEKNITDKYDWSSDHFSKPVYLTVSSQLQLEAIACSLGSVYTTNKSFRSEHSNTNKHLSEFGHLEIETCFISLDELMNIGEQYIKFVGNYLLKNRLSDIDNLSKFVSKGLKERIETIVNCK
jgi:asparaginyl-tRNA synthetase